MGKNKVTMKKIFVVLIVAFSLNSCGSKVIDPLASCEKSAEKFSAATTAFFTDFTSKSKCEAFKDAATSYIKSCPTLSAAEVKEANDSIKDINCNNL